MTDRTNKYKNKNAKEVAVIPDPDLSATFPAFYTPALPGHLLDHLIAIDAALVAFVEENQAIYVDGVNGNDANNGSELAPVQTIAQAIVLAAALGGSGQINIAAGTYAEGDLAPPDNWDLVGRNLDVIIAPPAAAVDGILLGGGVSNRIRNLTITIPPTAVALAQAVQVNGVGTYDMINVQIIGVAAALVYNGITVTGGATLRAVEVVVNIGAAGLLGQSLMILGVSAAIFIDSDLTSETQNTVDTGTLNLWSSRVTVLNAAAGNAVVLLTTGAILGVYNSILNNGAPDPGPNGYTVGWGDASAVNITLSGAMLQNNGGYAAAGGNATVVPEAGGGSAIIINNLGFVAPPADINASAAPAGLDGFENGVTPIAFQGVTFLPGWAGLGGGATPFAVAEEYDQWIAIARIARALDALIATVAANCPGGGPGVALGAYVGGQIP